MTLITGKETIGDVVTQYPQITNTLLKYGLHCVGCHVSYWETLEEGARGHGMDDETVKKMIEEANTVAQEAQKEVKADEEDGNPVFVTVNAVEKVKELMKKNDTDGVLRIAVTDGGCAGQSYEFKVDKKKDDDLSFEKEGLTIVMDAASAEKMKGSRVDYVESFQGSGFKVDNPHAQKSCGCGNSFS